MYPVSFLVPLLGFAHLSVATPLQIHTSINQKSNLPGHRLPTSNDALYTGFFLRAIKPDETTINDPGPLFADSTNTFCSATKGSFFYGFFYLEDRRLQVDALLHPYVQIFENGAILAEREFVQVTGVSWAAIDSPNGLILGPGLRKTKQIFGISAA